MCRIISQRRILSPKVHTSRASSSKSPFTLFIAGVLRFAHRAENPIRGKLFRRLATTRTLHRHLQSQIRAFYRPLERPSLQTIRVPHDTTVTLTLIGPGYSTSHGGGPYLFWNARSSGSMSTGSTSPTA